MARKQSSPERVSRFDTFVAQPGAERRILFGCPVWVLDGERYATLYQDRVVLRLSPSDVTAVLGIGGERFAPHPGRTSKERVILPEDVVTDDESLRSWVAKAVGHARAVTGSGGRSSPEPQ